MQKYVAQNVILTLVITIVLTLFHRLLRLMLQDFDSILDFNYKNNVFTNVCVQSDQKNRYFYHELLIKCHHLCSASTESIYYSFEIQY